MLLHLNCMQIVLQRTWVHLFTTICTLKCPKPLTYSQVSSLTSPHIQPTVPVTLVTESRANHRRLYVHKHNNRDMPVVQEWFFSTRRRQI